MSDPLASLRVEALAGGRLRAAYPLIQAYEPGLTMTQWMRYAGSLARGGSRRGVLAALRQRDTLPCGVVCWLILPNAQRGAMLHADHLVALDLLYPERVMARLTAALETVARSRGAPMLCVTAANGSGGAAATALVEAGFTRAGATFSRPVAPSQGNRE